MSDPLRVGCGWSMESESLLAIDRGAVISQRYNESTSLRMVRVL
jgi:hypothetical protein